VNKELERMKGNLEIERTKVEEDAKRFAANANRGREEAIRETRASIEVSCIYMYIYMHPF
jgi:hypothetical protein